MKADTHERVPVRVLVADDSAFMRTAIKRLLEADPEIKVPVSKPASAGQKTAPAAR